MNNKVVNRFSGLSLALIATLISVPQVFAQTVTPTSSGTSGYSNATPIDISSVLNFGWSLIKTGQTAYTVVAAGALVALGFALAFSGDNTNRKMWIMGSMGTIVVGGILIWGAPWIAGLLNTATQTVGH